MLFWIDFFVKNLFTHCLHLMAAAVNRMVRKRSTAQSGGGESSESQQGSGGHGGGAPPQQLHQQQQGGRGYAPQHQAGGNHGRGSSGGGSGSQSGGMASQQYYGGAPHYIQQQGRGTTQQQQQQQQHYGGPSEYYQPQGRGTHQQKQHTQQKLYQQPGGGQPQQHGGGGQGGFLPSTSGPSRPFNPELHQATQALHQAGVMTQSLPYVKSTGVVEPEARSLSFVPEPTSQVTQQFQQLSVLQEGPSSEIVRPIPASRKSLGFPLRPGRGSFGSRCIVKANQFFAELPDKDLHQYDVSISCPVIYVYILVFIFHFETTYSHCSDV